MKKQSKTSKPSNTESSQNSESKPKLEKIISVLNEYGCDVDVSAKKLGIAPTTLRDWILKDPKLRALFSKQASLDVPSELEQLTREAAEGLPKGDQMTAVMINNLSIIADGLEKNGISKGTIDKLKGLGSFEKSAGKFLVGSLDIAQRMVTFSTVSLFEKADHIDKNYLQNPSVSPKDKLAWQRMYNSCVDQMFKGYSNILSGTVAMTKLLADGSANSQKPGFKPLPGNES